jgi:flagellar basal-body rod protein FlgC
VMAVPISPDSSYGGGVQVAAVLDQEGDPAMMYAPGDPRSDEQGYMQGPVIDLAGQMGDMILASRTYQANMSAFKEARDALESTTTLGRR